jgi:hypothetical protein
MKCDKIKDLFPDYASHHLEPNTEKEFNEHLAACPDCRQQIEQLTFIWQGLQNLPEEKPSPELRNRFDAMLEAYKQGLQQAAVQLSRRERFDGWIESWWPRRPVVQFALSAALLVCGLFIGNQIDFGKTSTDEVSQLRDQIHEMRQMVTLSLLAQPSSSERIRGISWSTRVDKPNDSLISALLNTLNSDPNVNVRLAAVDALTMFGDQPGIRPALIQSLTKESSPLVQICIIDLLVTLKEKRSLEALRNLITDQKLNPSVKQRAEWGIEQLL